MKKIVIKTSTPEDANQLAVALANPMNAWDVAAAANNTVEVFLNDDTDAALDLLAALITAQPQYIALGIQNPLADSLKQTAGLLRNRGAQIDAAVNGDFTTAQHAIQRFGDPLTLDLDGDGIETVPLSRPPLPTKAVRSKWKRHHYRQRKAFLQWGYGTLFARYKRLKIWCWNRCHDDKPGLR